LRPRLLDAPVKLLFYKANASSHILKR